MSGHTDHLPHVLYRLFSAEGDLLYIGITSDFETRMRMHLSDTLLMCSRVHGWAEIHARYSRHTLEQFADRVTAHDAEKAAIRAERPRLNVHYNTGAKPRPTRKPRARTVLLTEPGRGPCHNLAYTVGRLMVEAGMDTNALADASGLSAPVLARRLLNGEFYSNELQMIARAFGLRASEMVRRAERQAVSA